MSYSLTKQQNDQPGFNTHFFPIPVPLLLSSGLHSASSLPTPPSSQAFPERPHSLRPLYVALLYLPSASLHLSCAVLGKWNVLISIALQVITETKRSLDLEEEWQHWIEKYLCPGDIIISSLSHPIDSSGGELIASEANKQSNHILLQVFFIWFTVLWVLAGSVFHAWREGLAHPESSCSLRPSVSKQEWLQLGHIQRSMAWPQSPPCPLFSQVCLWHQPLPQTPEDKHRASKPNASMPRTHSACASFLNILTPWCLDRCWARADRG